MKQLLYTGSIFKKLSSFFILLLACNVAFAQNYQEISRRIDSLNRLRLPKSALIETDKLYKLARQNSNAPQQIKAVMYRIRLQSQASEYPLVDEINILKREIEQSAYPAKPILYSLLGEAYGNYYRQNRYQFSQRTHLEKPDPDFTKWDLQTINNEVERLFILSLKDEKKEQETPTDDFDIILNGDRTTRYLRPTLYDLLVQNALNYFLDEEPALTKPKMPFTLDDPRLFGNSRDFASLAIKTTDTSSTFYQGIKYLQQATIFHLQKPNEEALADIDLKRLEFLNQHATLINKDDLYLGALRKIAEAFSSTPISADAQVLLGKYYQDLDSLKQAVDYFNKAVVAFPQSYGARNATGYLRNIQRKILSAAVEDINIPGKPILGSLNYRNVTASRVIIYKVSLTQFNQLTGIRSPYYRNNNSEIIYPSDSVFTYLHKLTPVQDQVLQLPDPKDYKSHSADFKIEPLKLGHYVLVVRDAISNDSSLMQLTTFKVSRLSYVTRRITNNQLEVRVMDRETGAPIPGVKVTLEETKNGVTDSNGSIKFIASNLNSFSIKLTTTTDTLYKASIYSFSRLPSPNFVSNTILFTDRQIYRPGQTVYYKGLQLQTQHGKSTILPGATLTVNVLDNNRKSISSTSVQTNEFGTFAGSFSIPQNILNGYVTISTANGNKVIRVEEYKRPGFEAEFLPVKESYKPNDSVILKGLVTAYSGYGLSMARVAYHITCSASVKDFHDFSKYGKLINRNTEIITDTIRTDNQGNFKIKFKAIPTNGISLDGLNYRYWITADITDSNGETRSANTSVTASVHNITILTTPLYPQIVFLRDSITASINNLSSIAQNGTMQFTVYAIKQPEVLFKARYLGKPDQFLLSKASFKKDFPDYAYGNEDDESTWAVKNKVAEITINTNDKQPAIFKWNALADSPTGSYKIVMHAKNEAGDTTSLIKYVYLVNKPGLPAALKDWVTPLITEVGKDNTATFLVGIGRRINVLIEKYNDSQIISSKWFTISGDKQQLIKVPVEPGERNVNVSFLMVSQNRLYTRTQSIQNQITDDKLDIKFLTFRDNLQPGEKEQWKIQVSGKNKERQAAEMVADLYDASLDAIGAPNDWYTILNARNRNTPQIFNWDGGFVNQATTMSIRYDNWFFFPLSRRYEMFNALAYNFRSETAAMASVTIDEPVGNSDAQIVTEDANKLYESVESVSPDGRVMIRGNAVTTARLNGKDYMGGDIAAATRNLPADILARLDNKDYGYAAGNMSFDEITIGYGTSKAITPRTNFNETAFFYPQLHTDSAGQILIDFTIPESLTKWRFRAFAHTKDLKTGYIEREIVTQKQLSISANMPRFLREGDTLTVSARLSNLTVSELKGTVNLQLLNAVTMQPVSLLLNPAEAQQNFDIAAATNKAVSFKLVVPAGLDALTYRITAASDKFSDGEENTLPVLPNRMLVTESMPMMVRPGQTKSFTFDKLVNQQSNTLVNKSLTLEYTQNPAWYAIQALPYMMEFPYECAEQVFSRYYANSLATNLVNKMPVVKRVFEQWKAVNSPELLSNLEKNQELKATLIEETPWLRNAANETEQKKRIALLFDLNKMSYELKLNLDKLKEKQLPDGGFPWFGGDRSDAYITRYILAGIGQLYHAGAIDKNEATIKSIADKATAYLDNALINDADQQKKFKAYDNRALGSTEIHAWYTESYYSARMRSAEIQTLLTNYLNLAQKQWNTQGIYEQGMIALTMLRNKKPEIAQMIIKSLLETAQQNGNMGMYWAKNQLGYFWYQAPIETQSLMIELFTEAGNQQKAVDEMKIWLLRNKQANDWKTTKATAQACYALLIKGDSLLSGSATSAIKLDGKLLTELKPDLKKDEGTGYFKTTWINDQVKPVLGKVEITNSSKSISWGALYWQYTEKLDKITSSNTDIHLERKYFIEKQTNNGTVLTVVDAQHTPKTGDLLKVVVYLKSDRDFEYVQLKDMRPAGTEPVDVLSAYKYQDGLYYYQVTKDVATNFFISRLNKGNYVFEYRLRVVQPGNYSTGISAIQSMYAPEFNAHSEGTRLIIGK